MHTIKHELSNRFIIYNVGLSDYEYQLIRRLRKCEGDFSILLERQNDVYLLRTVGRIEHKEPLFLIVELGKFERVGG